MAGTVVAMGGGGFPAGGPASPHDDLLLELHGRERPHVVVLPTATGDADSALAAFAEVAGGRPGACVCLVSSEREELAPARLLAR